MVLLYLVNCTLCNCNIWEEKKVLVTFLCTMCKKPHISVRCSKDRKNTCYSAVRIYSKSNLRLNWKTERNFKIHKNKKNKFLFCCDTQIANYSRMWCKGSISVLKIKEGLLFLFVCVNQCELMKTRISWSFNIASLFKAKWIIACNIFAVNAI